MPPSPWKQVCGVFGSRARHLKPDLCLVAESGAIVIRETEQGGKCAVHFRTPRAAFGIRLTGNSETICWLRHGRRPDGIIVEIDQEKTILHIIELKSDLSLSEWQKTMEQIESGLINGLALTHVLGLAPPSRTTAQVSFIQDNVIPKNTDQPLRMKKQMGAVSGKPDWLIWNEREMITQDGHRIQIYPVPRLRDADGVCDLP